MKTNPTITILNIRPSLRNLTMVAALLPLLFITTMARAQVTNVIYQDSFTRAGLLNGSMPDTVDATGAKYIAGPLVFTGNWTDQNGNTENACFFSNNIPALQGPLFNDAFLPIPGGVETGHVYTLTASILVNTNYNAFWMFLAFDTCPSLQTVQGDWYAGMLIRSTNNPAGNGNAQTFATAGTGTGATFNWTTSGTPWNPQFITYSIVLNLTNPAAMTESWYTNGVQIRTYNIGANIPGANNGMWPRYITFGQSGSGGYVTNLSLTDVVPFPAAPTISEPPNNLTASQGQTATFWVNAVGTPDPTYQWMSNGVAITGATNASYTTPALNMAYNGLSYSVGITNVAGGTVAGPATLTVTAGNPTVYSVMKTASPTSVVVNFSGPVDPVTSQNAANYTLNNGASVVSASAGSVPSSVVLTTTALDPNAGYYLAVQNVQDLFGDAMSAASTNVVLPAGLVLNLRGDSGVQLDTGGNVAQWLDQTTNGNNASDFLGWRQSTSGLSLPSTTTRPASGTTINGLQTLTFNSANNTFLQAASSPSLSINTNITIYCVSKSDLSVPQATMISKTVGNQPGSFEFDVAKNGVLVEPNFIGGAAGNGAAGFSAGVGGVGNIAAAHVFMATRSYVATYTNAWSPSGAPYPSALTNWFYTSSNTVSMYLDGIVALSNAVNNAGAPGPWDGGEPVYIGEREDHYVNTHMNGQIAEILVFNTALSSADRTNVDNYLGLKWFTPFFATPPPNPLTTSNGFAVTISPGPSYGSIHGVTLQWQENGTNLPGATSISYTTSILAPTDNNDVFSLIMSVTSTGSSFTNTTTLNVLTNAPYATWAGIPVWDTTNQVVVLFDETVDPITATAVTNYSLNNGVSVLSAAIGNAPNQVVLTTTPITWNANPGNYTLAVSNVMDLYGYTMVGASLPLGLYPPNVILWLKASTGVVTDAGTNTVNEWDDQSGNGNNFIQQGGLVFEPHLATNVWGDVVLRFTNTPAAGSNYMYNSGSSTLGITGDMSLFAAVNFQPQTGRNGALLSKDGLISGTKNIAAPYDIYMGTSGTLFFRGNGGTLGNGTSYGNTTATLGPGAGYPCVVAVSETGSAVSQYFDNKAAGTGPLSNGYQEVNDFDAGNLVFIGYRADGFNSLTADLAELIVTTSGASSSDAAAVGNYLSTQHHFVLFNGNPAKIGVSFKTNQMTLSWPADHTGWQLQSNSVGLTATGAWYSVSGSTLTNQITVMPAAAASNVFYRMFYQQP